MTLKYTPVQLTTIINNMQGPTIAAFKSSFFKAGSPGQIQVTDAPKSQYESGGLFNGKVTDGTLSISNPSIEAYANAANVSILKATQAVLAHESSHEQFQQTDYKSQPPESANIETKGDWCIAREGEASYLAFDIALENGWNVVVGTSKSPNIYNDMLAATAGMAKDSPEFQKAAISAATVLFKADSNYVKYCYNPLNWKPGAYIPPSSAPGGGMYGGGAVWTSGEVPAPGGHWVFPVNSSDSLSQPDSASLIGLSATQNGGGSDVNGSLMPFIQEDIVSIVGHHNLMHMSAIL